MKHTHQVKNYSGTHQNLATELGGLSYNALAQFLHLLSEKMAQDATADKGQRRYKLAQELQLSAGHLTEAATHIDTAWATCKPYMPPHKETLFRSFKLLLCHIK